MSPYGLNRSKLFATYIVNGALTIGENVTYATFGILYPLDI
jgi:hypothetical protein